MGHGEERSLVRADAEEGGKKSCSQPDVAVKQGMVGGREGALGGDLA